MKNVGADRRVRGRKLQAIRRRHFEKHPLCVKCEQRGRVTAAAELDHIVPLYLGGADVESNRQGLCEACHLAKTARDMGWRSTGANEQGTPLDPDHHWAVE